MGMTVGSGKGPQASINVTPMIDVLLVLLIIFMILIPTVPTGERALIPQPSNAQNQVPRIIDQTVILQLVGNQDGRPSLKLNEDHVSWNELESRLRAIFDLRKKKVIFVKADRNVEWDQVAQAIDVVHTAGIQNVGLLTKQLQ